MPGPGVAPYHEPRTGTAARRVRAAGGKSEHDRTRWWVTPTRPLRARESATETTPPTRFHRRQGCNGAVRAHRPGGDARGRANPTSCKRKQLPGRFAGLPAVRGRGSGSRAGATGQPVVERNGRCRRASALRNRTRLSGAGSSGGPPSAGRPISSEAAKGTTHCGRRSVRHNRQGRHPPGTFHFFLVFPRRLAKILPQLRRVGGPVRPFVSWSNRPWVQLPRSGPSVRIWAGASGFGPSDGSGSFQRG